MPIRITGLNSGLDTESIISALVSSYSYKTDKYKKAQTKLSWKQDAWKSLNTKIYSLYNSVGNMRFSSAYNMKKTTVSDSTKVSITAGSNSTNGSYSIQVTSLAKAGYLTGGKLTSGTTATAKLSDLGYTGGDGKISLDIGGKNTDISVTADTTIQEVVNQLKEAGVNASYDETNRRIFVSSKSTGTENDFSLIGSNAKGTEALSALGLSVDSVANRAQYQALAAYADLDIEAVIQAKKDAIASNAELNAANANYQKAVTYGKAVDAIHTVGKNGSEADFETLKTLASMDSLEKTYVDTDGSIYTYDEKTKKYNTVKEDVNGNQIKVEVEEADITDTSKYTEAAEKYEKLAKSFGLITNKMDDEGNPVEDKTALETFKKNMSTVKNIADNVETNANTDLKALLEEVETAASSGDADAVSTLVASYETEIENNKTTIEANNATLAANEKLTVDMTAEEIAVLTEKAAYAKDIVNGNITLTYSKDATRVNGSDATIYVNGAEYTGATNNFTINGMTITATGVTGSVYDPTESKAVNATVDTDVQGLYDKIRDFLTQYNAIINEMTSLYNADSAKGYEPLTDEEKDSMSDAEVEKWEEKVKSALLRRDTTLSGVMSAMTQAMAQGVDVNGERLYLSDFGIRTMGYLNAAKNEHNAYHIDGDEDDVNTSGNADKLMAAIAKDPDKIIGFMQGLSRNLYEAVDLKMKSTELSSIYTVYNDKEMASEYSDYTSLIKKWEEKLQDQEDYYYKKFSAMETALAKLNNQTSSLSGLFGNM